MTQAQFTKSFHNSFVTLSPLYEASKAGGIIRVLQVRKQRLKAVYVSCAVIWKVSGTRVF